MGISYTGYDTYFRYNLIIETLEGKKLTANEISKKTNIAISTVYKIIKDLINRNVVIISNYNLKGWRKEKVFTLKPIGE